MHILLTDILSCPRCGPDFGLILLANRIETRRVLDGVLGCANCRARYTIRDGFGDLRPEGVSAASVPDEPAVEPSPEEAIRHAALMGVTEGPGFVLVAGPSAGLAGSVAALVENIEVVAALAPGEAWPEAPGVSRIAVAGNLPFYPGKLRAAWLSGGTAEVLLEDAARAVGPLGRLVLEPAPRDAEARLAAVKMKVGASQDDTMVAVRA
jgi:uncharacterized protein YbaR (Trm112 family)